MYIYYSVLITGRAPWAPSLPLKGMYIPLKSSWNYQIQEIQYIYYSVLITGRVPWDLPPLKRQWLKHPWSMISYTLGHVISCRLFVRVLHLKQFCVNPWRTFLCKHNPVFWPHWSALVGNNHHSDELTTSQIKHIQAIEIVLSIYCVNSTKCKLESNHHSKYPVQNTNSHF